MGNLSSNPGLRRFPWRRVWQPTSVFFFFSFLNFLFYIRVWPINNVVLFLPYNNMNQLQVFTNPLPSSLPRTPPLWVVIEHLAELPGLDSNFIIAIYFTHGSVCMSTLLSRFVPPSPSPHCIHKSLLYVCISIPATPTGLSVSFF